MCEGVTCEGVTCEGVRTRCGVLGRARGWSSDRLSEPERERQRMDVGQCGRRQPCCFSAVTVRVCECECEWWKEGGRGGGREREGMGTSGSDT